jgi:hypothetical protein
MGAREGYEPRQQRRRIKLPNDGLNIGEAAREGVYGDDIAIPH